MKKADLLVTLCFAIVVCVSGVEPSGSSDLIPAEVEKTGPNPTQDRDLVRFLYFSKGQPREPKNLVAHEDVRKGIRVELRLYKDGKQHGIQRKWFENGNLKSTSPFKHGLMHGVFREWDEEGKLTAQYKIVNGSGTKRIHYPDGQLRVESLYSSNLLDGLSVMLATNQVIESIEWYSQGSPIRGVGLYANGSLSSVSWFPGPVISFREDGTVGGKRWTVGLKDVAESEYAKAASETPSLPAYFADAEEYRRCAEREIVPILEKYRLAPRLKSPLQIQDDDEMTVD